MKSIKILMNLHCTVVPCCLVRIMNKGIKKHATVIINLPKIISIWPENFPRTGSAALRGSWSIHAFNIPLGSGVGRGGAGGLILIVLAAKKLVRRGGGRESTSFNQK
jgi:hypothetical protein